MSVSSFKDVGFRGVEALLFFWNLKNEDEKFLGEIALALRNEREVVWKKMCGQKANMENTFWRGFVLSSTFCEFLPLPNFVYLLTSFVSFLLRFQAFMEEQKRESKVCQKD